MARRRPGFEWPVYAAVVIFAVGRISYALIGNYQNGGLVAVIAGGAVAVLVGGAFAWHSRRQIRDWLAKEPPNDKA